MDLVSIIIPAFNREKTILNSVQSVLQQTYTEIEVIVVDDFSTDNTWKIIQSISDTRVTAYRLSHNSGACAARNFGIKHANGKYIAFNDSDDIWHPDKLEKQMFIMRNYSPDIVFCQFQRYDSLKKTAPFPNLPCGFVPYESLIIRSKVSTQTMLVHKRVFESVMFDESMPRMQDYDFTISAGKMYSFYFLNQCLVDVYLQSNSITTNDFDKLLEIHLKLYNKYKKMYSEYPDFEYFLLSSIAYFKTMLNESAFIEYKRMLMLKHHFKDLFKCFFAKINLLNFIYRRIK